LSLPWFALLVDVVRWLLSLLSVLVWVQFERLLLSVDTVLVLVLRLLLSVLVAVLPLLLVAVLPVLLLSVAVLVAVLPVLLMSVAVEVLLLSVARVVVCVTVLPPRPTTESSAWALSEKASEIAVTSKVLFIRVSPLGVSW